VTPSRSGRCARPTLSGHSSEVIFGGRPAPSPTPRARSGRVAAGLFSPSSPFTLVVWLDHYALTKLGWIIARPPEQGQRSAQASLPGRAGRRRARGRCRASASPEWQYRIIDANEEELLTTPSNALTNLLLREAEAGQGAAGSPSPLGRKFGSASRRLVGTAEGGDARFCNYSRCHRGQPRNRVIRSTAII